ncbi:hypothetical protein BDA99DRAFT_491830 [Phascolomyces articulosus]|uniref:Uncharacterized protein n=1 Tax=Phascolomyces articulosus TaxID=60185 RepID=A0AAD5KBW2_9FUNG|nr:hypothetical protein BDA99DRAFT_491830 [Phascolomyces articulosus]
MHIALFSVFFYITIMDANAFRNRFIYKKRDQQEQVCKNVKLYPLLLQDYVRSFFQA